MAVGDSAVWEVVGGADRGGILVRSEAELSSPQLAQRLSTGSLVRQLELADEGRVRYELLSGEGPASGWVSTALRGKALLARTAKQPPAAAAARAPEAPWSAAGQACSAEELQAALPALRWYSEQLESSRDTAHQVENGRRPATNERWQEIASQSKPAVGPQGKDSAAAAMLPPQAPPIAEALLAVTASMAPGGKTGNAMKILPLRQPAGQCASADARRAGAPSEPHVAKVALAAQGARPTRRQHQPLLPASVQPALEPAKGQDTGGVVCAAVHDTEQSSNEEVQEVGAGWEAELDAGLRCPRCHLPIGDWGYLSTDSEGDLMHSECRAQLLLEVAKEDDRSREAKDAKLKDAHRAEHGIGWSADHVPQNARILKALGCGGDPAALTAACCLVLDADGKSVRVVPTIDAATSVNLEYLALALQVRRREGREPLFSLDPVDAPADGPQDLLQRKRFEPAWLAGTSVGDVMFQADYHLKELSMGEYEQPVVGMKSCLDLAKEDSSRREWRAREWFVVKQAGIYLSDGNVLTPHVRMGVEAREQIRSPKGIVDARLTRRDHPLVRYAESFTQNFDLIAERKSVIYHLRELAKASVLAKYLVDDKLELEDAWFEEVAAAAAGPMEVPQLWNERRHARIQVRDGRLVDAEKGVSTSTHGVYGGVAFQLEEVPTMQAARLPRAGATVTARQLALAGGGKARSFGQIPGVPKGVDLNLDSFDLSGPVPLAGAAGPAADEPAAAPEAAAACAKAFWFSLGCNSGSVLAAEDRRFFKALFNPHLSDRPKDGQRFALPQTSSGYIQGLRKLVSKEDEVHEQRRKHFLSKDFLEDRAGSLYPGSWESSIAIAREHSRKSSSSAAVRGEGWLPTGSTAANLQRLVKTAAPVFDKHSEDGTRFRIYRVGSFEVRTIQKHDEKEEAIGMVFSTAADSQPVSAAKERRVRLEEKVAKVTEYVEAAPGSRPAGPDAPPPPCHYFAVIASAAGDIVVAELRSDGALSWAENPEGLDARIKSARVTGCSDGSGAGATLEDLRAPRAESAAWTADACLAGAESRRYTRRLLELAPPAARKGWAALAASQRRAAASLGVDTAEGWDLRAAPVWRSSWWDLSEQQRKAAQALGLNDDTWEEASQRVPAAGGRADDARVAVAGAAATSAREEV